MRPFSFSGPRQFRPIFMATMSMLSVTLAWLSWQLLVQGAQIESQRRAERRDAAADLGVAILENDGSGTRELLPSFPISRTKYCAMDRG